MKIMILSIILFMVPLGKAPNYLTVTENGDKLEVIDRDHYSLPDIEPLFIDHDRLNMLFDKLNESIYRHPNNAYLDEQGKIIEEEQGIGLDQHEFYTLFLKYFYQRKPTNIAIPKKAIFPRVTSELLADIRVKKMGDYVTFFKENNQERSHNISLATAAINNKVIFPGETFSFNKIVGKRTEEKGYMRAPVIVKGELAEDIGGGICQVSSTLFNAVSLRGIEIVERYSHSRHVPYVPPGKDATVSWWGPDFVFKNNYNHPILIRAKSNDGKMGIEIYSSDMAEPQSDNL